MLLDLLILQGNDDQAIGRRIVKKAILEPFTKILTNAGHDINDVRYAASKLIDSGNDFMGWFKL
jgi:chaperonin GroEL (HSP60 family)